MLKKIAVVSLSTVLFYSCGSKSNTNSGSTPPPASSIFANAGPTSCLPTTTSSLNFIAPYYTNFQQALASPFKIKAIHHAQAPKLNWKQDNENKNVKIIGPNATTDQVVNTTNCNSTTSSPSAKTIASNNTVGIFFPASGQSSGSSSLCSGAIVGDGSGNYLILTAAHCFNSMSNYSDTSAGGATVYIGNDLTSSPTSTVSCWQRNPNYHNTEQDFSSSLFDVAWIKLTNTAALSAANLATVLATPSSIASTDEKLFAGFGTTSDGTASAQGSADGNKRCVSTQVDPNYGTSPTSRGDIIPSGATSSYNTFATTILSSRISNFTSDAFGTYLAVFGPINGQSSVSVGTGTTSNGSPYHYPTGTAFVGGRYSSGTCFGDSGGPVYVRNGGQWVLAALTEGSDNLLSPHPIVDFTASTSSSGLNSATNFNTNYSGLCIDGYGIYTTLGSYVGASGWITTSSGITVTTQ